MSKIVSLNQALTKKIALSLMAIFLLSFFFLTYFFIKKFENDFHENIYNILSQSAHSLVSVINEDDKISAKRVLDSLKQYSFIKSSKILKKDGQVFLEEGSFRSINPGNHFRRFIYHNSSQANDEIIGVIEIHTSSQDIKDFVYSLAIKTFLFISLIMLVITLTLKKTISNHISPIENISDQINQIENVKKINITSDKTSIKEIYKLYNSLEKMKRIYDEYQTELETQVAERTYELEEYKAHLEAMVEEKTKDFVAAKEEADKANKEKSEFLANITHELRTPMHAMINYSELGQDNLENKTDLEKLKKYFNNINKSGKRLLKIINDLLDVSKYQSGMQQLNICDNNLKDILKDVLIEVDALLSQKNISIKFDESEIDFKAECDRDKIFHVIMNLVSNSLKFSPEGSVIEVSINDRKHNFDGSEIDVIAFRVADSGPGIPKKELDDIFSKFVQSSATKSGAGGTGLGLSICREIIEAHKGVIWAENTPKGGAEFTFILPKKIIMEFSS